MQINCRGTAKIRHAVTDEIHEIDCDELDWDAVGGDEREMGPETHYEAVIEHSSLGLLTWGLWEYPLGAENCRATNVGMHQIVEDFEYGLEHGESERDDWLDYEAPSNPYMLFSESHGHSGFLLATAEGLHAGPILNRMVFSHQITALEAYLADTLINEVLGDNDALRRLIVHERELKKEKFTMAEITETPDLVQSKVRNYLRNVLYHNLEQVNVLYNIALEFKVLDLAKDRSRLLKAVLLRHDCVHRNGYDKDGNELTILSKEYVQETADQIRDFVDSVETAVRSR